MRELHRVLRPALAEGPQLINVAEHIGKRDHRLDDLGVAPAVGALDLAAAAVDVADDVAEIILRRHHLDLHDRLEQRDAGLLRGLAHRAAGADLERKRRRIDVVIFAIDQLHLEVDDREADKRTGQGRFAHALFDRRDIFLRNVAALDVVGKDEARAALAGLELDLDLGELAGTARLLLMGVGQLDRLLEIFAIGDLRRADIGLDLELALHAIDQDLEVELAHSLDDGLAAL